MHESRTYKSKRNVIVSLAAQLITVVFSFTSRTVFAKILGLEYLGIANVFSSVLTILSIAELGIGEAISFALYKPLAEDDKDSIMAIMQIFKKVYRIIALVVLLLGCILCPFLRFIIGKSIEIQYIYVYYFLFVLNSVSSYLCAYKRTLLVADQKKYIESISRTVFLIIMYLLQIVILLIWKSYLLFLLIQVAVTIMENVFLSIIVNKHYPFILSKNKKELSIETRKKIYKVFGALFIQKVNGVIAQSIDNIVLSVMLGTIVVGRYSNYMTVEKFLTNFLIIFFTALAGSVGNLIATETKERQLIIFEKIDFMAFWIMSLAGICFYCGIDNFIDFWLGGNDYFIGKEISYFIILNFYILGVRQPVTLFKNAYGLYWEDRFKPILSAVINITSSVILTYFFGIIGVVIGTTLAYLLSNTIIEPIVLFKHGFNNKSRIYFKKYILRFLSFCGSLLLFNFITSFIKTGNSLLNFLLSVFFVLIAYNFVLVMVYKKNDNFMFLKNQLFGIFKRKET